MGVRYVGKSAVVALSAVIATCVTAAATTYHVAPPSAGADSNDGLSWATPFATIFKGIAVATNSGDLILVSNGTYIASTPITLAVDITIRSMNGADVTLIDGQDIQDRRCVDMTATNAILDGFTIMRGKNGQGAGVRISAGTIQNCTIRDNYGYQTVSYSAGGFWMTGGVISNCIIRNNLAYQYGGGVYLNGDGLVIDCTIISNRCTKTNGSQNRGAGVYATGGGRVERCEIRWNSATTGGGGVNGSLALVNCLIADNEARGYSGTGNGGGVYMTGGTMVHCTVENNTAISSTDGIYQTGGAISNCIVYYNGEHVYLKEYNNIIQSGGTVSYTCATPEPTGTGNTADAPGFADRFTSNYRLLPGSPCLDTAATTGVGVDLDGTARPIDGDNAAAAEPDMGCYEAADPDTIPFTCNFNTPTNQTFGSLTANFTSYVGGTNTTITWYGWSFGDAAVSNGAGLSTIAHTYGPGQFDVTLTVTNSLGETATRTKQSLILVAGPTNFVSTSGSSTIPYNTWATAATNVADAVAAAWSEGTNVAAVVVSNGTYVVTSEIRVEKAMNLSSVNGPLTTILDAEDVAYRRVLLINSSNAIVSGFTVMGGYIDKGAGIQLSAGTVSNCIVRDNYCYYNSYNQGGGLRVTGGLVTDSSIHNNRGYINGGGFYLSGGTVRRCTVVSNQLTRGNGTTYGGGAYLAGGLVEGCTFSDNTAKSGGGGVAVVAGGYMRNCLIENNQSTGYSGTGVGGGLYQSGGAVESCTVAGNTALDDRGDGLYMTGGTITNSIVYHNGNVDIEKSGGTIEYSCTPNESGTGNITDDPAFINSASRNYQLEPTSQCIGVGTNQSWMVGASDLNGTNRIIVGVVDMGCFEAADPSTGPLTCDFAGSPFMGNVSLDSVFTVQLSGADTNINYYWWDFGDGNTVDGPGLGTITNTYAPGQYDVSLIVSNSSVEVTNRLKTAYITVVGATAYVATNGSDTAPYNTWAKAATNIQDALDIAWDDGTNMTDIVISNGTYALADRLLLSKNLDMRSANGPAVTILDAGDVAQRRVLLITATNAFVSGFTITGGFVDKGAGIQMAGGVVSNCVIQGNYCYYNTYQYGGGVWLKDGLLIDCTISDNRCYIHGGGVYASAGTIRRCTIVSNSLTRSNGSTYGAGVYMENGLIENCELRDNTAKSGGGGLTVTANSTARNCLVTGNRATGYGGNGQGGGIYQSGGAVENCTLADNTALDAIGDGLYMTAGTVSNSIIYHNAVTDIVKTGGTLAYSCTPSEAGTGNTTADPAFEDLAGDDLRLQLSSPCINAGTNQSWMAAGTDLDGTNRVILSIVDMGCYEAPDPSSGPLQSAFAATPRSGYVSIDTVFTAIPNGSDTNVTYYWWDFGDSGTLEGAGLGVVTNTYSPGRYDVSLAMSNSSSEYASSLQSNFVMVAGSNAYISHTGTHTYPYDTWARAATNIPAAVSAAWADPTNRTIIIVADGVFTTETIMVTADIEMRSLNGPDSTTLDANDVVNRRIMSITASNAFIHGFTMTGGNTDRGAALRMEGGVVSNCVIRNNLAFQNTRRGGGGVHIIGGVLTHSVIRNNRAYIDAGGVSVVGGIVRNCIIASNEVYRSNGTTYGGGVWMSAGVVENCLLIANEVRSGGGGGYVSGTGILRNSTLSGGSATGYAGTGYGGGLYVTGGGVTNIIAFGNTAVTSDNDLFRSGGTITYSCAPDLIHGVDNNISQDPLFEQNGSGYGLSHTSGVYTLLPASPCVDAGIMQSWMSSTRELSGLGRILGLGVEMGAYEFPLPAGTLFIFR